jgi:hypothetical protein
MLARERFQSAMDDGLATGVMPGGASPAAPLARGPAWVLAWAAAGSLLIFVAIMLLQFGLLLANQRKLARAAQCAATEAALPRATPESIAQAARRSLRGSPRLAAALQTMIRVNGRLQHAATELQVEPGDALTVNVAASATAAVPDWLRCAGLSIDGELLQATAKRRQR